MARKGLKGIDNVMRNLNKELKSIKGKTLKGLIIAAAEIRGDMDKTPPKIPVDTGNLRASWSVVTTKGEQPRVEEFKGENSGEMQAQHGSVVSQALSKVKGQKDPLVIMLFTASYAESVHEELKEGNRPGSGGLFFEAALARKTPEILRIVAETAKI